MSTKKENKKDTKKTYNSFDELAQEVYGLKPASKKVSNNGKRKDMQDKFEKRNVCKSCGKPMVYTGGNIIVCANPDCKKQPFRLLDERTKSYAQAIYGEAGVVI